MKLERDVGPFCSFCGKGPPRDKVIILAGPDVYICHECVALCVTAIGEEYHKYIKVGDWTDKGDEDKKRRRQEVLFRKFYT